MGATAVGSGSYIDARIVGDALDIQQKVIHGFNSSSDARLALLRGDIFGMWSSLTSAMKGVRNAQEKIVLQLGPHRHPSMPAIPATGEILDSLGGGTDGAKLVDIWHALNEVGRVIVAPPDVDESKLAFLRQVVESSVNDEEFVQLAAESRRDLAFLPSHELQQLVESFAALETDLRFELLSLARSE
ncbi:MAG: hypothetical protein HKN43_01980 [Rhodothermales bacterium]|nr:hypothetical protein [Rhodothermales bacterium]